ncbi:cellulose synthase operon protein YhjQ/BcsQ [Granulicella tundricola]|uniref:Cellulose synthase operon protein YhjQ n=1 Tax=Granulicella tundricola (strain ATCC BAA-1859 / DSM 23138 / MP5ACTX9) TaxID=1198114 RepID=E8X1E4_GRATM|nr:cellulose synthase operon protein YhjQ/BcsQ [Granulicella tundricola]ADW69098.1 cellulose synthase operon protein YhjQ [Granulicella tundricola MP5ACTX9]
MEKYLNDNPEEPLAAETPEDVAILYSWANLHGAKYRDFSASRREYRAQVRHRAAEELRHAELQAAAEAERAAAEAEQIAREAERAAHNPMGDETYYPREQAILTAEEAARRASAERVEAARRAEAAAFAEAVARREEREIAEAHASAARQAARWAESDTRRRSLAGPQPSAVVPGLRGDPYMREQGSGPEVDLYTPNEQLERVLPNRYRGDDPNNPNATGRPYLPPETPGRRRPQGYRPDDASGIRPAYGSAAQPGAGYGAGQGGVTPAWLNSETQQPSVVPSSVDDTLQHSRERVASRWYGLKDAFEPGQEPVEEDGTERHRETRTPFLAVFSLAGGVGKTSMVATLGRSLSSLGEKVLLTDTTSHGLLPFYFGASELRAGVVRTFSPPSGSTDAPIYLVSYDVDEAAGDRTLQDALADEITKAASGTHRVLLDLNTASAWLIRRLIKMSPTILVPVAPDMNSVISLQAVERFFHGLNDQEGRAIQPYYLLNQFDAALPLHLDVREVLRRQLGDRLLPYVIRRSPAVSEALAEGMTVVDYAQDNAVAKDYLNVAHWLRSVSAPATQAFRNARWSER